MSKYRWQPEHLTVRRASETSVERRVIGGRPCSIIYFDENSMPVDKTTPGHYARILFDDGDMITLKAPDSDQPLKPGPTEAETARVGKRKTFNTYSKAIAMLDESEVEIRDLIERDLQDIAGVSGTKVGAAMHAVDKLMAKIRRIRLEAIKASFRHIRDNQ
jgi:hypothetical protein